MMQQTGHIDYTGSIFCKYRKDTLDNYAGPKKNAAFNAYYDKKSCLVLPQNKYEAGE
jgi:hypothetical protein